MSIKLVAIDIDGTLLNEKREVTKEVKEAIAAAVAKGVSIVLCTGRPLPGVQEQLNELNLFQDNDYVITYNGALVQQTKSGKIIARHGLTHEDFLEIEVMARRVGSHLHSIDDKAIYTPNRDISAYTIHEASLVKMPLKYRTPEEMTPDMNIVKMMMIDEPEILDAAIAHLPQTFRDKYTTVKSAPYYFEVLNKEASKGAAVANLAQHLGIDQDEIMAIGDNENDLSMIEYAGLGVAMGNAVSLVKEAANVITSSNDEHGVAEAIKKYVL
ncbi:sugar-phosphatase [Enterococcus faecium]|uniref:Cof-type HAD-IIB family hydrolase n=1 Tax=Enterococcus faecium TaxID=1352 RepID=A0A2G0EEU7_ENTFC|nr:sugar-phosphatase [Enterococcus faecium]KFO17359.1 sugar phosphatase [Enterococcus faecium UC7267]KGK77972.1 sugar phosphatase [Enterococcus faecium]MBK4757877.1 sugar phosphatase [Enterococcus faecium]MBK4788006.1 sugar phosphatase [Enterococcus faecium]MBK4842148.1 sugar phosphatase [Enterococcus faecium]